MSQYDAPEFFMGIRKKMSTTHENMTQRVRATFQSVTPQMLLDLRAIRTNILCIENDDSHFKHLL